MYSNDTRQQPIETEKSSIVNGIRIRQFRHLDREEGSDENAVIVDLPPYDLRIACFNEAEAARLYNALIIARSIELDC